MSKLHYLTSKIELFDHERIDTKKNYYGKFEKENKSKFPLKIMTNA